MRRYVLVSYDISDPARWRKVFKIMRGSGQHVQYSVFLCQLTDRDEAQLIAKLEPHIHHDDDQVMLIRIGSAEQKVLDTQLTVLGRDLKVLDIKGLVF